MTDLVRSDVEAYAERHTTPFGAWMDTLHDEAARELPYPSMLSGPVVGRLLETLVHLVQPRLVVEFAIGQPAVAGDKGRLVRRAARAGLQQVGQGLVAQQLGLVRTVEDIGMPCQRRDIVHQRLQLGLVKSLSSKNTMRIEVRTAIPAGICAQGTSF